MTYSWNASLAKAVPLTVAEEPLRVRFVLGEERRRRCLRKPVRIRPATSCRARARPSRSSVIDGLVVHSSGTGPHDQVLRNQSVGSRCSVAVSGPRLAIVRRIRMSFGAALAYSAKTSK